MLHPAHFELQHNVLQVPDLWKAVSYPSESTLAPWLSEFDARMHFVGGWLYNGLPKVIWLPGLFDPLAFITAVQQRHARQHSVAIDALDLAVVVTPHNAARAVAEVRSIIATST